MGGMLGNLFGPMVDCLADAWRRCALQRKYRTCRFYPGAVVDRCSSLGQYNVIFAEARIVHSDIGDHTFIQRGSVVNHASIGKFCSIAQRVTIGLGRHPIASASSHPAFYSATQPIEAHFSDRDIFEPFRRTSVGHDVWIGQGAMIVDGVTIGTGAVIGAGAVVTKDIPPYAVAVGVPARVRRYRFDEATVRGLLESRWWDRSEQWLRENQAGFSDPLSVIERCRS